jgi:hypothetical protein
MAVKPVEKIECLNPHMGRRMSIDVKIYDLFSKAIYHVLKGKKIAQTKIAIAGRRFST